MPRKVPRPWSRSHPASDGGAFLSQAPGEPAPGAAWLARSLPVPQPSGTSPARGNPRRRAGLLAAGGGISPAAVKTGVVHAHPGRGWLLVSGRDMAVLYHHPHPMSARSPADFPSLVQSHAESLIVHLRWVE